MIAQAAVNEMSDLFGNGRNVSPVSSPWYLTRHPRANYMYVPTLSNVLGPHQSRLSHHGDPSYLSGLGVGQLSKPRSTPGSH